MGIAQQKLFWFILSLPNLLLVYDADSILQFNINQLQSFDLNLNSWDARVKENFFNLLIIQFCLNLMSDGGVQGFNFQSLINSSLELDFF